MFTVIKIKQECSSQYGLRAGVYHLVVRQGSNFYIAIDPRNNEQYTFPETIVDVSEMNPEQWMQYVKTTR